LLRINTDTFTIFSYTLVANNPFDFRKDSKIPPHPNVNSWVNSGPDLPNDNITCSGKLTSENFNAAPLARTIPTVPGRSLSFFMSHGLSSHINGFDLHCGKMLAVSTLAAVVFTPFLFEH